MALEDRDAKFEKALAGHLRDATQREACPDAELLAAYHERTMTLGELNSWKQHISGCARCQEVLAQLEATEEIPLDLVERQRTHEPQRAAAGAQAIDAKKDSGPRRAAQPRFYLRWVVPAGAIAAGLLLWVAAHERKIPENSVIPPVQVAENPPEPRAVPLEGAPAQPSRVGNQDQWLAEPAAPAARKKVMEPIKPGKIAAAAPSIRAPSIAGERARNQGAYQPEAQAKEQIAAQGGERQENNLRAADQKEIALDTVLEQKKLEMASGAAPAPPQPSADKIAAAGAPAPEEARKDKAARAAAATASETVELNSQAAAVRSAYSGKPAVLLKAAQGARLIFAPDGKSAWRLGNAGVIEYSPNGGKKWTSQSSGVTTDLVAGSAPSKDVCWLVGRAGTILLTTDGGASWKQLASPINDDLGGIHASDALHAVIWDAHNARSYDTMDGGVTWRGAPNE